MVHLLLLAALSTGFSESTLPKLSVADLKEDFTAFRTTLEQYHPGIYRYSTKAEMDKSFDEALGQIKEPMNALAFYRLLAPLEAEMHCGHSRVFIPEDIGKQIRADALLLPVRVKLLDEKLYVLHSFGGDQFQGKQIESINGVSATDIFRRIDGSIGHDGSVRSSTPYRLSQGWGFNELLVAYLGMSAPYEVKLSDSTASTFVGETEPKLKKAEASRFPGPRPPFENAALSFQKDGKVAVLKVWGFSGPLDKFFNRAFKEIADRRSESLILDLRDNGGGEDELGKDLFAHLVTGLFDYYKDLVLSAEHFEAVDGQKGEAPAGFATKGPDGKLHTMGHPNWGTQKPQEPTFGGKVFILVNGGSFSTTGEFMSTAFEHKRATFIGEESGAGLQGNNSGLEIGVVLPRSKVRFACPFMRYEMAVTSNSTRGIMPDVPVAYSIDDVLKGRDKEMEVALKLAGG